MNLFRLQCEDLTNLGNNYAEQKAPNQSMTIAIEINRIQITYDNGSEKPFYGLVDDEFTELISN